ncbi:MAG: YceI family protein [Flavobacteriales bacterium]
MKTNLNILSLIAMMGIASVGYAQSTYKIKTTKDVDVVLQGTSTLHDWHMDAKDASGDAQFVFKPGSKTELVSVKSLSFSVKAEDLKSDSKGLDKNAYKALKTDTYKDIHYTLTSATLAPEAKGYLLKSVGKLTIAGVTKDVSLDVHCVPNSDGTITCYGTYKLNMTDYKVVPPSFMFGAMTTGDSVTLIIAAVYSTH